MPSFRKIHWKRFSKFSVENMKTMKIAEYHICRYNKECKQKTFKMHHYDNSCKCDNN